MCSDNISVFGACTCVCSDDQLTPTVCVARKYRGSRADVPQMRLRSSQRPMGRNVRTRVRGDMVTSGPTHIRTLAACLQ